MCLQLPGLLPDLKIDLVINSESNFVYFAVPGNKNFLVLGILSILGSPDFHLLSNRIFRCSRKVLIDGEVQSDWLLFHLKVLTT